MIEANNSDHDSSKARSGHHNSKPSYLRWVFIFGGIAIAGLLAASIWWPNLTERTKFFTGNLLNLVIALAVIAQVLIYRKQWQVMDAQWQAMEQQTEYANRAYVCIPSGTLKVVEEIGSKKEVTVFWFRIENTGSTPANDVSATSFADIAAEIPDPALLGTTKQGYVHHVGVIAPKSHAFYFVRAPEPSGKQLQDWIDGKVEVYCSGFITYRSFGKTRTTKFCFLQRPLSPEFESYGKWNEAD